MGLKAAKDAGYDADAVVVHKSSHTAYYPGSQKVSLMLIWDRATGKVLGAQAAGRVGIDKRLDVIATAIAGGLTLENLEELDLAYAPPFNSPNGPIILDVRTPMEFSMGSFPGAINVGLDNLVQWAQAIEDKDRKIIVYCASGARSSYGLRLLAQQGFTNVENGGGLHDMMSRAQ